MSAEVIKFLEFNNPTLGRIVFADVLREIIGFMKESPQDHYRVMIGSDSNGRGVLDVVSVVVVHRVGSGGRYFWHRSVKDEIHTLRQKIYAEVDASLKLATIFVPAFRRGLKIVQRQTELPFDFEIHVDVGVNGPTRDLIKEVTGMVRGYGYEVQVKPESAAATTFADRHVK